MKQRTYRMYGLVNYQLSPIQMGIQFGHAVVEYANKYFKTPEYQEWATRDKTFIILNGGTTNTFVERIGTLNQHTFALAANGIRVETFFEPDLGDQLTAVVFLVDDRVWDRELWPDYTGPTYEDGTPHEETEWEWKMQFSECEKEADKILFLRNFLPRFRLA